MILGIGIDSVEVERFSSWSNYTPEKLLKIFSKEEIDYCQNIPAKSAERFAARFAAREAFFKATSQMAPGNKIPFLTLCRMLCVSSIPGQSPRLKVDWPSLSRKLISPVPESPRCWLSITHTNSHATVVILLESNK